MSRHYAAPEIQELGSVEDLTRVGQTNAGGDALPGQSEGKDGGSMMPPGLDR